MVRFHDVYTESKDLLLLILFPILFEILEEDSPQYTITSQNLNQEVMQILNTASATCSLIIFTVIETSFTCSRGLLWDLKSP